MNKVLGDTPLEIIKTLLGMMFLLALFFWCVLDNPVAEFFTGFSMVTYFIIFAMELLFRGK